MIRLIRHPLFIIGFLIIAGLLIGSVVYSIYFKPDHFEPMKIMYDEHKTPIAAAPFKPSEMPPFGSDRFGHSMFIKVLDGAKYTLGIAFSVAFLRLLLSFLIGVIISLSGKFVNNFLKQLIEAFNYTPMTIIVYLIVAPVLVVYGWNFTKTEQMLYPFIVLVLVAVPSASILISDEIKEMMKQEFIVNSKVLGGRKLHILRKHVMPFLSPRLLIIFTQQVIGTLLIMAHLGVLKVFVGGRDIITLNAFEGTTMPVAMLNEWSGMIGGSFHELMMAKWIILAPIYGFVISILALNFMIEGMKSTILNYKVSSAKRKKWKRKKTPIVTAEKNFEFVKNEVNKNVSSL